jgi:hypothetical protein
MFKLDAGKIRELAVAASCDPRTIVKVLQGKSVRAIAGFRELKALHEAGLKPKATKEDASTGAGSPDHVSSDNSRAAGSTGVPVGTGGTR